MLADCGAKKKGNTLIESDAFRALRFVTIQSVPMGFVSDTIAFLPLTLSRKTSSQAIFKAVGPNYATKVQEPPLKTGSRMDRCNIFTYKILTIR